MKSSGRGSSRFDWADDCTGCTDHDDETPNSLYFWLAIDFNLTGYLTIQPL